MLILTVSLFLATICLCGIFFAFFIRSGFQLISPLTKNMPKISSDDMSATIKDLCQKDHISCRDISVIGSGSVQITLDNDAVAILSTKKDLKNQLTSLQQALSQLTIKGKQFKKLDFRFANTVVTF